MAQTIDTVAARFYGAPPTVKRAYSGTIAAGKRAYLGALQIAVDGVIYPAASGSALKGYGLLVAGADANGGSYYRARRTGVTVSHVSGAAESIAITYGATTNVAVTYNNGTSTAATIAKLVSANAEAAALLITAAQGTGASSPAAASATAGPFIEVLGACRSPIDNSGGGTALAVPGNTGFDCGIMMLKGASNNVPLLDGVGFIVDDNTVTKVADAFNLRGTVRALSPDGAFAFLDLNSVV